MKVNLVPYECSVAGLTRIIFGLLRKMKSKMMVVEAFVLFLLVALELNGGIYTIAVIGDRHVERILIILFLMFICLFIEFFTEFPDNVVHTYGHTNTKTVT